MIFKTNQQSLVYLASMLCMTAAMAQGVRLAPTPAMTIKDAPASQQADFIVAVVNSEPITNNEVKSRLIRYERRLTSQGAALPSRADLSREILEDIIREKLQLKLAKETGIRIDDRTLDAAVQTFATQNKLSLAELKAKTSADGIGYTQIRSDILNQLLVQKVRERDVLGAMVIPDSEIEAFIKEQQSSNTASEPAIDLAQILVALPESANQAQINAAQDKATRLFARAKAGEDFIKLARENSDAKDARSNGGQMGLRPVDRYPTLFTDAIKNSNVGDVVGPIRSGAGFHLLKLLDQQLPSSSGFVITQSHINHILLRTGPSLSEAAAKAKLLDIKKRVDAGAISFESAAKEFSQDGSAESGGELGWSSPGQFVPEFETVMNALPIGKISEPTVSRFGVHLLLVKERRNTTLSPADQREIARNALREKKFEDAYTKWIRELRSNAYVEIRDIQQ